MKGDISPPPLKRQRRVQITTNSIPASSIDTLNFTPLSRPTPGSLRIFSWNINGITPFVQPYIQTSIESFFKPSYAAAAFSSTSSRKRQRQDNRGELTSDSEDGNDGGTGEDDPSKEGAASLRLVLQRYGWPHVLFLQEIKIKKGDDKTMGAVRQAVNDTLQIQNKNQPRLQHNKDVLDGSKTSLIDGGPEYEVHFNLPADPHNAKGFGGKVYGVAAIIRGDFESKFVQNVRDVNWDREGRIQVIETREITLPLDSDNPIPATVMASQYPGEEHSLRFAMINIYAVNGTSNPYRSTYTGAEVGTRHDRKLAVHTDLLREARDLENKGFQVIIAGDLNIARCDLDGYPSLRTRPYQHCLNRDDFNKKFFSMDAVDLTPSKAAYGQTGLSATNEGRLRGFDGIDTFRHTHGSTRKYSYHSRGVSWGSSCDRVDLIIASRTLSRSIANAGIYDSPRDRGPSDHCPIWVELGSMGNEGR